MELLFATALAFPSVVYTVFFCVVLVYWVFVIVGGLSSNLLGHGADGAADGIAAEGGIEGVAKGAMEGVAKGGFDFGDGVAADGADVDGGDVDGGDPGEAHTSGIGSVLASLKLRSAPATLVLSLVITFSWLISVLAMEAIEARLPGLAFPLGVVVLLVAPLLALLPTSLLVRPLGRLFITHQATSYKQLVGKVCRVRTGTVTERFGEATIEGGGAELVVRVRVDARASLKRGEQALIVEFDEERDAFVVEPLRDVLEEQSDREA